MTSPADARTAWLAACQAQLRALAGPRQADRATRCRSGWEPLDRLIPRGILHRGGLYEWLAPAVGGGGAGTLALRAAAQACGPHRPLVVIDPRGEFYPPAAAAAGFAPGQLVLVRPGGTARQRALDAAWAWEQVLGTPGLGAVLGWPDPVPPRTVRRWQLAAESAGGLGLLVRPETVRRAACWAAARWLVTPRADSAARSVRVEWLRGPGAAAGTIVEGELHHDVAPWSSGVEHPAAIGPAVSVPVAARLAPATAAAAEPASDRLAPRRNRARRA